MGATMEDIIFLDLENPFRGDEMGKIENSELLEVEKFLGKLRSVKSITGYATPQDFLEAWWKRKIMHEYHNYITSDITSNCIKEEILRSVKKGFAGLEIEYNYSYFYGYSEDDVLINQFRILAQNKIPIEDVIKFLSQKLGLIITAVKPNPWLSFFKSQYIKIHFIENSN